MRIGDRLAINNEIGCGKCPACRAGAFIFCMQWKESDSVNGGFGELLVAPAENCLKLADQVDYEAGRLIFDNFGIPYSALEQAEIRLGDDIIVAGLGPIGLAAVMLAKLRGAYVIALDPLANRRWQENDLIFPTTIGTPRDPHNLLKWFKEILGKAGLPDMRFQDLRHASMTLILNDIGTAIKEAQHRAGHVSPSTTINNYGGETTSKLDEVVARNLDELVTPVSFKFHPNCTKAESLSKR